MVEAVGELVRVGAGVKPRVGPVRGREREQRRRRVVEVGAELAELASLAEESPEPLFVAAALGHDLVVPLALEVAPLADEDGRDVELVGDDTQVRAQREPDLLRRRQVVRDRVEGGVERVRALAHRLVEQILLRLGMRVERALLHAHRLGEIAHRRAVVALLGKEPGGLSRQLGASSRHRLRCRHQDVRVSRTSV